MQIDVYDGALYSWVIQALERSKIAIDAHDAIFDKSGNFRNKASRTLVKDVHAFFTQAAMVARVFNPSAQLRRKNPKSVERAQKMCRTLGVKANAFDTCLQARHDLDHYDERVDFVLHQPNGLVSQITSYTMRDRSGLTPLLERPTLLSFVFITEEQAIVTLSPKGNQTITPIGPIYQELTMIHSRCDDFIHLWNKAADKIPREKLTRTGPES